MDGYLREVVDSDKMQYRFMPRRETVDVVFVLRRLSEKVRVKKRTWKMFFLLTWKILSMGCQGKFFVLL